MSYGKHKGPFGGIDGGIDCSACGNSCWDTDECVPGHGELTRAAQALKANARAAWMKRAEAEFEEYWRRFRG